MQARRAHLTSTGYDIPYKYMSIILSTLSIGIGKKLHFGSVLPVLCSYSLLFRSAGDLLAKIVGFVALMLLAAPLQFSWLEW